MDVMEKTASKKRLIDANALLRHKRKMSGADFGGEFWDEAVLTSDIKNAPTVDAVEVVRCRDCIGRSTWYNDAEYGCAICGMSGMYLKSEDGYCSYELRKGGDDNG